MLKAVLRRPPRVLFLANVLSAVALLFLSRRLAGAVAVLQFFFSLLIISYIYALRLPPTATAVINGFSLLDMTGGGLAYINQAAVPVLLLSCGLKLFLIGKTRLPSRRLRICMFAAVLAVFCGLSVQRLARSNFTLQDNAEITWEIWRLGYLLTWTTELLLDRPAKARTVFSGATCSGEAVAGLPVFSLGRRVTLIQVESLDYSAVNARGEGRAVAPALSAMAGEALLLRMDGTKVLASANSDYELFNTKIAENDVLYYSYLIDFPDSIFLPLHRRGYATTVFHGLRGNYMNLRQTYGRMGFSGQWFLEELKNAGCETRPDMFMNQVPDGPLLDFAASRVRPSGPYIHFIITVTMHDDAPAEFRGDFAGKSYYNSLSYFDAALGRYVQALPEGDTVIIYGDHQSYSGPERSGTVPFIIWTKGRRLAGGDLPEGTVYSRCEMSHYLRALFAASFPEEPYAD